MINASLLGRYNVCGYIGQNVYAAKHPVNEGSDRKLNVYEIFFVSVIYTQRPCVLQWAHNMAGGDWR